MPRRDHRTRSIKADSREQEHHPRSDQEGQAYNNAEEAKQLLKLFKDNEIRFHDLRHSCASVLLAQGVPMKQIQEWLGHSDMSTTANIYSHLDAVTKADTGAARVGVGVKR